VDALVRKFKEGLVITVSFAGKVSIGS